MRSKENKILQTSGTNPRRVSFACTGMKANERSKWPRKARALKKWGFGKAVKSFV